MDPLEPRNAEETIVVGVKRRDVAADGVRHHCFSPQLGTEFSVERQAYIELFIFSLGKQNVTKQSM